MFLPKTHPFSMSSAKQKQFNEKSKFFYERKTLWWKKISFKLKIMIGMTQNYDKVVTDVTK